MVYHLTSFIVPVFGRVVDHSIHAEVDVFGYLAMFGDDLAGFELLGLEFFQVIAVKAIIAVLQKLNKKDGFLIHELGKLRLQRRGQNRQ